MCIRDSTLDSVDDDVVGTLTRRRRELDMRREGRTAHTDDAHLKMCIRDRVYAMALGDQECAACGITDPNRGARCEATYHK